LLCSDGLSDFDRLEECWAEELKPVLLGQRDVQTAVDRLVEIANTRNGHDNVTIGLIHIKVPVRSSAPLEFALAALDAPAARLDSGPPPEPLAATQVAVLPSRRQVPVERRSALPVHRPSSPLLLLLGLGVIGGGLGWIWTRWLPKEAPIGGVSLGPAPSLTVGPTSGVEATLAADRLIKVIGPGPYTLLPQPGKLTPGAGTLPSGAILKVTGRQTLADRQTWVKLQVCTVPSPMPSPVPSPVSSPVPSPVSSPTLIGPSSGGPIGSPVGPGASGWVEEATILPVTSPNLHLTPDEQKACSVGIVPNSPASPPASPLASPPAPSAVPSAAPVPR
jgi:protein phosphatase